MEIHLIRHTPTEVSDEYYFGQSDVNLRLEWKDDFSKIQLDSNYSAVYTSPLKRCKELAEFFQFNYFEEPRMMEFIFGDWEMKKWDEIPPEQINPWYEDFINVVPPNVEGLLQLQERVINFMEEIKTKHSAEKILIITHSGIIRLIWQYILGFPIENMFRIQPQHGKKTIIFYEHDLWKITALNI